jgi:hypothetical protein
MAVEFGETLCKYGYDAAGRRIFKQVTDTSTWTATSYIEY